MSHTVIIHERKGGYSDRWIEYCRENEIAYKAINALKPGIMRELQDGTHFLWHLNHRETRELLVGPSILSAAERMGIRTFPDPNTRLPFEDKVAQKYLFEALDLPLVPTEVFLRKDDALLWAERVSWPKVFKLRRGAGSHNVKMIHDRTEAIKLIEQAFSTGFNPVEKPLGDARVKANKFKKNPVEFVKKVPGGLRKIYKQRQLGVVERGYFYIQEFMPDNDHDTRVTVIGNRVFAFRRHVRPGDWRASGGGKLDYDLSQLDMKCVEMARDAALKLKMQSVAFDVVYNADREPRIVEISCVFDGPAIRNCVGHWDLELNWHDDQVWPQDAILADLLE